MSQNLEPLIAQLEAAQDEASSAQYDLRKPQRLLEAARKLLELGKAEQLTAGCIAEIEERVRVRQQQFDAANAVVNRLEEAVCTAEAALKQALPEDEFDWDERARSMIEREWRDEDVYFRR